MTMTMDTALNQGLGLLMYVVIIAYLLWDSMRAKKA